MITSSKKKLAFMCSMTPETSRLHGAYRYKESKWVHLKLSTKMITSSRMLSYVFSHYPIINLKELASRDTFTKPVSTTTRKSNAKKTDTEGVWRYTTTDIRCVIYLHPIQSTLHGLLLNCPVAVNLS
jgi:hypothetical protein